MANERTLTLKSSEDKEVKKDKVVKAYRMIITAAQTWNEEQKIYIHANGLTVSVDSGDEVVVPPLVKEILDSNVRHVKLKNGKIKKDSDYRYSIIETIYE